MKSSSSSSFGSATCSQSEVRTQVTWPTVDQSEDSIAVSHHVAEVELGVERGVGLLVEAVPGALPLKPLVHLSGLLEQEFKNYGLKSKLKYNKWISKINLIFICLHAHSNWSTVGLDIIQNRLWK